MEHKTLSFSQIGECVLSDYWRKQPAVFRKVLPQVYLSDFDQHRFLRWISLTKGSVRLFESYRDGSSKSGLLPDVQMAKDIYTKLSQKNIPLTLHMNDIEIIDQDIFQLRQQLKIPYWWRVDDVIGTLSTIGSGIGYHAGHEDGFIIQLAGSRRWRVWSADYTPISYKKELLSPSIGVNPVIQRPLTDDNLLLDIVLDAGDILYIPPFFPHEGITLLESISLSFAWKGLGPASFLPSNIYRNELRENKDGFGIKSVNLFEESNSVECSIENWNESTLATLPKLYREKLKPAIRLAVNRHFENLMKRYESIS